MDIYPVILSGGAGTRLWPLSREALPKQFLRLLSDRSLLQETLLRVQGIDHVRAPVVVANQEHRFLIAEHLRAIDVIPHTLFLEPVARNTAPALAAAALRIVRDSPDALMLVLPSDHHIPDGDGFRQGVADAVPAASAGHLVTFGITPRWPETGYGYIEKGEPLQDCGACHKVSNFLEKPNEEHAARFVESGQYYWNSGMFLFGVQKFLDELERLQPVLVKACTSALDSAQTDLDFVRLGADAFAVSPSISIDYAVLEHTQDAAVLPVDYAWTDLGSWKAMWESGAKDPAGNVTRGDVQLDGAANTFICAEHRLVAAIGVDDLVIVETPDAVLVAHRDEAQRVRQLVEELKLRKRKEPLTHRRVYRPWGSYEGVDEGARFQVKHITVNPGAKLSLQMHHHRAEHWVVVCGTAKITRGEEVVLLTENQSTYIPLGVAHRLENPGKIPLQLIEVQSGAYLGEDDIVRLEDVYNRVGQA
jgi:mannose-1-phosphate guanylyltransferase/mannose-6-phosphate isomerase